MGVSLWNLLLLPEEPLEAADAPAPAKSLSQGGFGMRFFLLFGNSFGKSSFQGVAEGGSVRVPRVIPVPGEHF